MLFKEIKLDFFERKLVDGNKVLRKISCFKINEINLLIIYEYC